MTYWKIKFMSQILSSFKGSLCLKTYKYVVLTWSSAAAPLWRHSDLSNAAKYFGLLRVEHTKLLSQIQNPLTLSLLGADTFWEMVEFQTVVLTIQLLHDSWVQGNDSLEGKRWTMFHEIFWTVFMWRDTLRIHRHIKTWKRHIRDWSIVTSSNS